MNTARVFVVEDELIIARDIINTLNSYGYQIAGQANSSNNAIEKISDASPEIVLMDITLDDGPYGIELAAEVKDLFNIPVIFLTAHSDEQTIRKAQITEPYAYITKPFKDEDLNAAIQISIYKHKINHNIDLSRGLPANNLQQNGAVVGYKAETPLNDYFRNINIFSDLREDEIGLLSQGSVLRSFKAGDVLFREGSIEPTCFLVIEGRLLASKKLQDNHRSILELIAPGDLFGILAGYDGKPLFFTVKAHLDSKVILLPRSTLMVIASNNLSVSNKISQFASSRFKLMYNFARAITHEQSDIRIAAALVKLIPQSLIKTNQDIEIQITRQEIADLTGMRKETAIRTIKKMEENGILKTPEGRKKVLIVTNYNKLLGLCSEYDLNH